MDYTNFWTFASVLCLFCFCWIFLQKQLLATKNLSKDWCKNRGVFFFFSLAANATITRVSVRGFFTFLFVDHFLLYPSPPLDDSRTEVSTRVSCDQSRSLASPRLEREFPQLFSLFSFSSDWTDNSDFGFYELSVQVRTCWLFAKIRFIN